MGHQGKSHLLKFEVQLVDHCNLNCANCSHYSPLVKQRYLDLEEYEKDCKRLSDLFNGEVEWIHLMGGEPLLFPDLEKVFDITRGCFLHGQIVLVTNGILLDKLGGSFWDSCKKNNIEIYKTEYPIKQPEEKAHLIYKYDDRIRMRRNLIDERGIKDPCDSFKNCFLGNECIQLRKGKLYTCPTAAYAEIINDYFSLDINFSNSDYVDIYSCDSAEDIMEKLSNPIPFCKYCCVDAWRDYEDDWTTSQRDIYEWVLFTFSKKDIMYLKGKKVYIYGAGKYGLETMHRLTKEGIDIECFIVTNKAENFSSIEGIAVVGVDDIVPKGNDVVLLAAYGNVKIEMQHLIRKKGFKYIIPIMSV